MVDRQTRVKKKKFRKTPGSRTSIQYSRDKNTSAQCAVTGKKLHGIGNSVKSAIRKRAKSQRRPNVKFGGVLSGPARKEMWENYALVVGGRKDFNEVPAKLKKFLKSELAGHLAAGQSGAAEKKTQEVSQ